MASNKKLIHGPRFAKPQKFKKFFYRGYNRYKPRYIVGVTEDGTKQVQSVLRPVYYGEMKKISKLTYYNGDKYVFVFKIKPKRKLEGEQYKFYTFTFDKDMIRAVKEDLEPLYKVRVFKRTVKGIDIYIIYRRRKRSDS